MEMQKEYRFYTPPQYSFYLDKETWFENNVRQILAEESANYIEKTKTDTETDMNSSSKASSTDAYSKTTVSGDNSKLLKECVDEALSTLKDLK